MDFALLMREKAKTNTLLLFVRAGSGSGFDAFQIDAAGLSWLGLFTADNTSSLLDGRRPDAVAVCAPLDPEGHAFVQSLNGWMKVSRIPVFSLWSSGFSGVDPFKVYEAVWGLHQSANEGSPAAA